MEATHRRRRLEREHIRFIGIDSGRFEGVEAAIVKHGLSEAVLGIHGVNAEVTEHGV